MRRSLDQQSGGEFAPAVSATRRCHAPVQAHGYVAEIHVRARVYSQPFQSRTPSHRSRHMQDPSLRRHGGVEESCKLTSANVGFLGVDSVTLTVPMHWLAEHGVSLGQGFLFSRPLFIGDFLEFLRTNSCRDGP